MTLPIIFPPSKWKVMIVDDDPDILALSKSSIKNIQFRERPLQILLADSEKRSHELLQEHSDIALIFIDIEMEHRDSGYRLVHHIRKTLNRKHVRLILRTGQALSKAIRSIVEDYDINDYLEKSVTDPNRFYMATYTSLRSYKAIVDAEKNAERYQEESKLKAQQLETFYRFVPQELIPSQQEGVTVSQMLGISSKTTFGVLFCDIRNFTSFAETISSQECFNFLNSYFSTVSPEVTKYKGFIYQLLGDGILAMYPCSKKNAARTVLHSAINIQDALHIYNRGRVRAGYETLRVGIGANLGDVAIGISGTDVHMSATAFGSTVNLASRCDDLSKQLSAGIVVTEHIIHNLDQHDHFLVRSLGKVRAKGLKTMTNIYEVFNSDDPALREAKLKNKPITDEAFELFSSGNIRKSLSMFKALKRSRTIDPLPAKVIPLLETRGSIYYSGDDLNKKNIWRSILHPIQHKKDAVKEQILRDIS